MLSIRVLRDRHGDHRHMLQTMSSSQQHRYLMTELMGPPERYGCDMARNVCQVGASKGRAGRPYGPSGKPGFP